MGGRKVMGILALGGGLIVIVICIFADAFGLGGEPGFGWKQITGTAAGAVAAIVGLVMLLKKS